MNVTETQSREIIVARIETTLNLLIEKKFILYVQRMAETVLNDTLL